MQSKITLRATFHRGAIRIMRGVFPGWSLESTRLLRNLGSYVARTLSRTLALNLTITTTQDN